MKSRQAPGATTEEFSVASHFEGKEAVVRKIYARLLEVAQRMGPFTEEPKKTSIHLVNRCAFAGVATRKGYLILTLKSERAIENSRIFKSQRISANRYYHELKLSKPADVNAELRAWLNDAYALSV